MQTLIIKRADLRATLRRELKRKIEKYDLSPCEIIETLFYKYYSEAGLTGRSWSIYSLAMRLLSYLAAPL